MGFYTGCTGSIVYLGKPVAKVRDWSIETSLDMLDTTTLENCTKTFIPNTKTTTGSATLMYYRLESGESTTFTEFTALLSKIHKTGQITVADRVQITLRTSTAANDDIIFNAYITNAQISMSPNELVTVPIQFQVDGDFLASGTIT
jgi:hypothetical protein